MSSKRWLDVIRLSIDIQNSQPVIRRCSKYQTRPLPQDMQITTARSSPEPRGRTSASSRLAGGHREPAKHPHGPPAASRLHRTSGQPFRTRGIAPCGGPQAVDGSTTWPRARHEPRHHVPGASWRDTVPGTVNAPGRWPCPPIADRSERNRWMCPACGREDPWSRPVPGGGFRRRHEWRASPVCIPPPALPSDAVDRVGSAMRRLSRGGPLPCASVSPRTAPKAVRPMRLAPVRDAGATSADDPTDGHSGIRGTGSERADAQSHPPDANIASVTASLPTSFRRVPAAARAGRGPAMSGSPCHRPSPVTEGASSSPGPSPVAGPNASRVGIGRRTSRPAHPGHRGNVRGRAALSGDPKRGASAGRIRRGSDTPSETIAYPVTGMTCRLLSRRRRNMAGAFFAASQGYRCVRGDTSRPIRRRHPGELPAQPFPRPSFEGLLPASPDGYRKH